MFKKVSYLFHMAYKQLFKYKVLILFVFLYLLYFYVFHNGETNCIIKRTIGIPCMGCGMSRAFAELFSLNISEAFYYHPLVFIVPFIVLVFLLQETKFFSKFYHSRIFWGVILSLFVIIYIIRMILYFPHTEPMDYYSNPLIIRILIN